MPFMAWLLWSKNEKDPIQGPRFSMVFHISIDFAFIAFDGLQNVRNNGQHDLEYP